MTDLIRRDLRYVLRQPDRSPGFAAIAALISLVALEPVKVFRTE